MKITRIISGRRYSTQTATEICSFESGHYQDDFRYEETSLYQTASGRFFLAGYGGAMSRWAEQDGNDITSGRGIEPLDLIEARDFAESHANAETIARFFDIEEA